MKRVVWIAVIAAGAMFAGSQMSRAQYGGAYPQPYVPPAYTQQQVVPDLVPTVNLQPYSVDDYSVENYGVENSSSPPTLIPGRPRTYPDGMHTGYANERDVKTGWYVAGMIGALYLEDQFSEAVDSSILRQEDAAFDWNVNGGGAIGYRLPTRPHDMGQLRMEFDFLSNYNNVKRLTFNGVDRAAQGEVSAQSFMFNFVLDFIHFGGAVRPYVGGGVGVLHVREALQYGPTTFIDSDEVFGFQGMAGVSVQLWERVQWFAEWRYLGGSNPKFTRIGPAAPAPSRVELRSEYNTHSFLSGFRVDLR